MLIDSLINDGVWALTHAGPTILSFDPTPTAQGVCSQEGIKGCEGVLHLEIVCVEYCGTFEILHPRRKILQRNIHVFFTAGRGAVRIRLVNY